MARGNQKIAPTAHYTAQAWVRAGFENARLFDTPLGRRMYDAGHLLSRAIPPFAPAVLRYHEEHLFIRHYVYEERLRQLKPDYVLEIGAGLSPRGITFSRANPSLVYVEADLPNMVEAKRERLQGFQTPGNYHLTTVDLLGDSFVDSLPVKPRSGDTIAVITEGVTDYLSMNEKRCAWRNIAGFLKEFGGGRYLLEIHPRERYTRYRFFSRLLTVPLSLLIGRSFDDSVFERGADALTLLKECGFDDAELPRLEDLNTSRYQPPLKDCPWALLEARVGG